MIKVVLLASCKILQTYLTYTLSNGSQRSSIETLLEAGFKPTRTVVLAFGFDEEASGFQGAGHLGPHLEETYGKNAFAMIVDEGCKYDDCAAIVSNLYVV